MSDAKFGTSTDYVFDWMKSNSVGFPLQHDSFEAPGTNEELLHDHVEDSGSKRMPEAFYMDIFAALLTAAKFMRSRNVWHNDIKPPNILIDLDPDKSLGQFARAAQRPIHWPLRPILIDLGTLKPIHSDVFTSPDDFVRGGSRGVRPPEHLKDALGAQLIPEARLGEKAMVFSCAASIFRLLFPRADDVPFQAPNGERALCDLFTRAYEPGEVDPYIRRHFQARLEGTTSKEDCLYPSLTSILIKCLQYEPSKRPTCEEALAEIKMTRPDFYCAMTSIGESRERFDVGPPPALRDLNFSWPHTYTIGAQFE